METETQERSAGERSAGCGSDTAALPDTRVPPGGAAGGKAGQGGTGKAVPAEQDVPRSSLSEGGAASGGSPPPAWAAALLILAAALLAVTAAGTTALCIRLWPLGGAAAAAAGSGQLRPPQEESEAPSAGQPAGPDAAASAGAEPSGAAPGSGPLSETVQTPAGAYQQLWPELYVTPLPAAEPADKTVYLTFDDGPSANTAGILQTLADYGAQATWFVTGGSVAAHPEELLAVARAGHALGLHSDTHDYAEIYASVEDFLADMEAISARVEQLTGRRCGLLRFPGGSINAYNAGLYQPLCAEVLRRGYRYYDWNASAQDAVSPQRSAADTARRVIEGVHANRWSVVLLHDTKSHTAAALPEILATLSAEGYAFAALDPSVPMVSFGYGA